MELRNQKAVLAVACVCALVGSAMGEGDSNRITNPGFEEANPGGLPLGWNGINLGASNWVTDVVRTGSRAIQIPPSTNAGTRFQGWTTNIFLPDGSDLYDPDYTYLGGDVHVTGYYLVPEGQTLQDTVVGMKLEFRREPPNFSIYTAFEFAVPANSTGGQWMPFEFVVTDAMMEAVGDFPPYATSVTILPFRFFGGDYGPGTSPTGTIYFDDLCMTQGETGGPCNDADFAEPFGELDFFDVLAFLQAFSASDPSADLNNDSLFDFFDVQAYLNAFSGGCP